MLPTITDPALSGDRGREGPDPPISDPETEDKETKKLDTKNIVYSYSQTSGRGRHKPLSRSSSFEPERTDEGGRGEDEGGKDKGGK